MATLLRNNFYTIESCQAMSDDSRLLVRIKINKSHPVFKGHFPEHPVVPGVFMIQSITEILSDFLRTGIEIKELSSVKFISFIDPKINQDLEIDMDINSVDSNVYRVSSTVHSKEIQFLKCKGKFQKTQDPGNPKESGRV